MSLRLKAQDDSLWQKLQRFAKTWAIFKDAWDKGAFDYASARLMSREWRDVENSGE